MARVERERSENASMRPLREGARPAMAFACVSSVLLAGLAGCHGGRGASAGNPERQAESEYDLARDAFLNRHDPRAALGHAQKAVDLDDQNAEAAHLVALIYLYFCATSSVEDCRLSEAEKYARRAVAAKADFREAQNTLGVVLLQEKHYDDAIAVLKPLAGDILYPTPWDAWGNLGQAYLEKGQIDEAIDALRKSIAAQPEFCVGNYRLGLAYERKGDLNAAREALSRAVETNRPECRALQDAFEARARVLSKSNHCAEARGDWQRCKQIAAASPAGQRCASSLASPPCSGV
jgi:type IV pilus assembly protein PilF